MFRAEWSTSLSENLRRRGLLGSGLLAAALPALSGCGFRPLYARGGLAAGEPDVRDELRAVRVGLIGERLGQLVRRALYQRMGQGIGGPAAGASVYELRVVPVLAGEALGFQRDGTATRVRYTGIANWALVRLGPPVETLASGVERSLDAYNIPTNQFFASESSRDAAEARLAEVLAEAVVTRVAVFFRRQSEGRPGLTGPTPPAAPELPAPSPILDSSGRQLVPGRDPNFR